MGFTGFSSDQEGSIVYDGEKFIINNPEKVPENFDPGGKPVIYTQPPASTAPNNQPAPATTHQQNNMLNQDFNYVVAGVGEPKDKRKKKKKKKRDALAAGSGGQAIAGFSEHEGTPDISEAGLLDFEPEEATSLTGYTAVSEGQRQHIDYLLSTVNDDLAWVALVVIKENGLPAKEQYAEYMAQFAESGLADESDRLALELLDEVRHSDWDDLLAQADSESVETVAQDLADNTIEGLTVIDVKTGRTLLNRTGVLGAGGQQYVGLQDYEVEAFKGLELIFIHNHPNGSDASEADLRAAFAAGAEMLMVVTPQGYEYVYIRGADGMIRVRAEEASYTVAPGTAEEHALLEARSWAQARADRLNPPEWMLLQEVQSQLESDIFVPEDLTREQAAELFKHFYGEELDPESYSVLLSIWENGWKEESGNWPEETVLEELMNPGGVIEQAVQNWNHSASGMSDDEFAALLLAHLRQEGHYRRHYSRHPGDMFESFIDFWKNALSANSSVGPANLRIPVANELLGTAIEAPRIPMPEGFPEDSLDFDDSYKLDELVGEQWRNLDRRRRGRAGQRQNTRLAQEHLLKDDSIAIELAAANINRGVERLYRQYLYHELGLRNEEEIQQYLKDNGLQPGDLEARYLQQEKYRASMFNMLAWSSQGIAESDALRTFDGRNADIARQHASGGVRTVNAILLQGLFGLTMDADGVRLFNDDDVYVYREA